jgi:hypothetical protein
MLRLGVVAAAALALFLVPPAGGGGPLRTALNENGELDLPPGEAAIALRRMRAAGVTTLRTSLGWASVTPSQRPPGFDATNPFDPAYNWAYYDAKFNRLLAAGLEPLVVLIGGPRWDPGSARSEIPDAAEFGRFARAAAERYSGRHPGLPRIRLWQIWNEPNVNVYFRPQFRDGRPYAPQAYRRILNAAAAAIHSVRRDNVVVGGGFSPFTVTRGDTVTIGPLRFMRELLCMSAGRRPRPTCRQRAEFDVWSHHPYTSGGPTHQAFHRDDVSLGDLPEMRALLRAAVRARHVVARRGVRFWVTEFSWDTKPPDKYGLPVRLQARWTSEALYRMWRLGINLVAWLMLRDSPYPSQPVQSGLYYNGGSSLELDRPKPTLTAFRFPFVALRERGRTVVWGRTPDSRPATVVVERKAGRGWRRVTALRATRSGIFTARLAGPARGSLRARRAGSRDASLPFALAKVRDRFVYPFGCGVCP